MKYLDQFSGINDADSGEDAVTPSAVLEQRLEDVRRQIVELPAGHDPMDKAERLLDAAAILVDLERKEEAWDAAREAFDICAAQERWEEAVVACDLMFKSEQPESLAALGQGIWLAVTFPIDPELTVAMLEHVIDETPSDSDGAAVAAAVASYVVNLRAEGKMRDDLNFFVNNMLGTVARRHSNVDSQEQFDHWLAKLELTDPQKFLPRLRNVVDVLVQEDWWIDREALWAKLPIN